MTRPAAAKTAFFCQQCGERMLAPPSAAGRVVKCPACNAYVEVPAPASVAQPQQDPAKPVAGPPRRCPRCGKMFRAGAEQVGRGIACPGCGHFVAARAAELIGRVDYTPRLSWLAPTIGWSASLLIHVLLLVGLFTLSRPGVGGRVREAAIIREMGRGPISSAEPSLSALQSRIEPSLLPAEQPLVKPISKLGETEPAAPVDAAAALDAGQPAAGEGDWSSLIATGGGGTGGASFFGLQARGRDFVYVVDYSGSMSGEKLRDAKDELVRSISSLRRRMRFYIIFYNTKALPMPAAGLVKADEENKKKYFAWVQSASGGGGTDPTGAMRLALSLGPDTIWLLSDGLFDKSACDQIARANPGRKAQIHTVAFYENKGEAVLRRIAEDNRGQYRFVSPQVAGPAKRTRR